MQVQLKPDTQKFIDDQISAGRFSTSDEALNEAVTRMMAEDEFALDDETIEAINRAEAQLARGEGIDFDTFAAEMRRKISAR